MLGTQDIRLRQPPAFTTFSRFAMAFAIISATSLHILAKSSRLAQLLERRSVSGASALALLRALQNQA